MLAIASSASRPWPYVEIRNAAGIVLRSGITAKIVALRRGFLAASQFSASRGAVSGSRPAVNSLLGAAVSLEIPGSFHSRFPGRFTRDSQISGPFFRKKIRKNRKNRFVGLPGPK